MRSKLHIAAAALVVMLGHVATASANSDSLFTVGIGTAVGVNQTTALNAEPSAAFTTELTLKVKMLHVLGLEFSYSPTDSVSDDQALVFDSTFRMSGLLYIVPTYPVNFYLKGGIGAGDISDLFAIDEATNSYHVGAGMDFHIGDHFVLGAEFLLLIPGVTSIKDTIERYANDELRRYQDRETTTADYEGPEDPLGVSDFISIENFRVSVSARYYF